MCKFYMFIPIELAIRPSRVYAGIFLIASCLALSGIWLTALPAWGQALMTFILILGAGLHWRESSSGAHGLRLTQSGQIEILQTGWQPATIKGQPVVLPWLVSLNLVPEGGKTHRLIFWPDTLDADSARRLRVWLKWGHQTAS
jgi:toxin CptA